MQATNELKQLLASPPPGEYAQGIQAHNPHAVAHANLQALRDSGDPRYLFLRTTLELEAANSNSNMNELELHFHCLAGVRHVLLSKWHAFHVQFRSAVRDYCMLRSILFSNHHRTIRQAHSLAAASVWKRQWSEDPATASTNNTTTMSPEEQQLLGEIQTRSRSLQGMNMERDLSTKRKLYEFVEEQLFTQHMGHVAGFISTLVGEFSGKSSSNYNMPLEFHKEAHAAFQTEGWLNRTLHLSMRALSDLIPRLQQQSPETEEVASFVVHLMMDLMNWEFGSTAWDSSCFHNMGQKVLIRPPLEWRDILVQHDFVSALFQLHESLMGRLALKVDASTLTLAHGLRQLILLLASMAGQIFPTQDERKSFCLLLSQGTLTLLSSSTARFLSSVDSNHAQSALLDILSLSSRLLLNYKLAILIQLPNQLLHGLLDGMSQVGRQLLSHHWRECQEAEGDTDAMEHREWREETLTVLLQGLLVVCSDPWLLYSSTEEARQAAHRALSVTMGPLFVDFVTCRARMAMLEEQSLCKQEAELDEVREDISAIDLEEEMTSLAPLGRLDLTASLKCLASLFGDVVSQVQSLWDSSIANISPQSAGLLEGSRVLTLYIGHLLTDDNEGETPAIPDRILTTSASEATVSQAIQSITQQVFQFSRIQAEKIAANPSDIRLSPLLSTAFLWFLNRWAPAYLFPVDCSAADNPITLTWASHEAVYETISFTVMLCLHYHCLWPQEPQVQDHTTKLMLSLTKRCSKLRMVVFSSPAFQELVKTHCLTAGIRHSATTQEFESTVKAAAGSNNMSLDMLKGYHRLPYSTKSKILTTLLFGCSEYSDEAAKGLFNECLQALQTAFSSLVHALSNQLTPSESIDAKEMATLCAELYGGVARAGDVTASERIPKFMTPSLAQLSGLMTYYAEDLTICESLLRLFRDYAEHFIAIIDPESCGALFQASAVLLERYSTVHCASSRVTLHSAEEEQNYTDVLCAIQLLIQLGTKDFIDVGQSGVKSEQVTDMIFFGLQQLLPLMTRGLLQYPKLCEHYFSLVGFMMETYPEKIQVLPFPLFENLWTSLLYGISHHDTTVGKSSLQGLGGIAKEHLRKGVLHSHMNQSNYGILDKCSRTLLLEVVFQPQVISDRWEAAGFALLPIAAIDLGRFAAVVQAIKSHIPEQYHGRLSKAFEQLLKPEVLSKVSSTGYEGRQNRVQFKKDFELFCNDIHSFLILK